MYEYSAPEYGTGSDTYPLLSAGTVAIPIAPVNYTYTGINS